MPAYWLMKSEPDGFGIDDLVRVGTEPWSGVRSYQARNHMRAMQVDDLAFFYHSSVAPPGVVGIARIARTGVVDETQFEPSSRYHDPGSRREDPRWTCVDVELVAKLPRMVTLDELRATPALDGMVLLQKGSRLSVQPVTAQQWNVIAALAKQPAPAARKPAPAAVARKPAAAPAAAARKPAAAPARKPAPAAAPRAARTRAAQKRK